MSSAAAEQHCEHCGGPSPAYYKACLYCGGGLPGQRGFEHDGSRSADSKSGPQPSSFIAAADSKHIQLLSCSDSDAQSSTCDSVAFNGSADSDAGSDDSGMPQLQRGLQAAAAAGGGTDDIFDADTDSIGSSSSSVLEIVSPPPVKGSSRRPPAPAPTAPPPRQPPLLTAPVGQWAGRAAAQLLCPPSLPHATPVSALLVVQPGDQPPSDPQQPWTYIDYKAQCTPQNTKAGGGALTPAQLRAALAARWRAEDKKAAAGGGKSKGRGGGRAGSRGRRGGKRSSSAGARRSSAKRGRASSSSGGTGAVPRRRIQTADSAAAAVAPRRGRGAAAAPQRRRIASSAVQAMVPTRQALPSAPVAGSVARAGAASAAQAQRHRAAEGSSAGARPRAVHAAQPSARVSSGIGGVGAGASASWRGGPRVQAAAAGRIQNFFNAGDVISFSQVHDGHADGGHLAAALSNGEGNIGPMVVFEGRGSATYGEL